MLGRKGNISVKVKQLFKVLSLGTVARPQPWLPRCALALVWK